MIQVNRIYLIFNRLVTKKFLVDTSVFKFVFQYCKITPFPVISGALLFQKGVNIGH